VNAFFDRPVDVKEMKLLSKDGQPLAGELYHSVFDMAAVLKPKDPSQFKERMPVKVLWKVVDKLGRQAEGDNVWMLEVKEH
jgi:germination protein M